MKLYANRFEGLEERHLMANENGKRLYNVMIHGSRQTKAGYEVVCGENVSKFYILQAAIKCFNEA